MKPVGVLDFGAGNMHSLTNALRAIDTEPLVITHGSDVAEQDCRSLILPGVGSFGACMHNLRERKLDALLLRSVERGMNVLGICIGMQMLFATSEESPGVRGLDVLRGDVTRFHPQDTALTIPHMQWNCVISTTQNPLLPSQNIKQTWMYFVHSYVAPNDEACVAVAQYGGEIPAIVRNENVMGVQFHPEKSGEDGIALLQRFVSL